MRKRKRKRRSSIYEKPTKTQRDDFIMSINLKRMPRDSMKRYLEKEVKRLEAQVEVSEAGIQRKKDKAEAAQQKLDDAAAEKKAKSEEKAKIAAEVLAAKKKADAAKRKARKKRRKKKSPPPNPDALPETKAEHSKE